MAVELIPIYLTIFIFGIVIGSFLNVCILRIPEKESIVSERSHCVHCGYQLSWYDLIPVFSFLMLGGKCRKCRTRISLQYPIIEAGNGCLYVLLFLTNGFTVATVLYCLLASALLVLSVIDWRIYEIPIGINIWILILGILQLFLHLNEWKGYLAGFLVISIPLYILFFISKGNAIGGGDVKLMAAAGLLIGWKLIVLSFFLGCILGSVIHLVRMKIAKADHVLAMGPYLSAGIMLSLLWGEPMIQMYLSYLGR